MDAKIASVRWYWNNYLQVVRAIRRLCDEVGLVYEIDVQEGEKLRKEIAVMDTLMAEGFTHFQPIKKGK